MTIGDILRSGFLSGSVGNNRENLNDDVMRVKSKLSEYKMFDFSNSPEPHGYVTREMDQGIKEFQKAKGLKVDGFLLPDGETEKALFSERNERVPVPVPKPMVSTKDRKNALLDEKIKNADFNMADNREANGDAPWHYLSGYSEAKENKDIIETVSKKAGINPDFVKAIVHLETTQGYYDRVISVFGRNNSVRPMNIQSEYWKELGYSRSDLEKSDKNIEAGVELLKRIVGRMLDASVAKVATIYNNLGARKVSDYGARVEKIMKGKLWEEK